MQHPVESSIVRGGVVPQALRVALPGAESPLAIIARQLEDAELMAEIGVLDSSTPDDPRVFGNILDAAIDATGSIFVLDGQYSNVRVFSPMGDFRTAFGSAGRGPGELYNPMALMVHRDTVYITSLDRSVNLFVRKGEGLVFHERRRTPVSGRDICATASNILIQGVNENAKATIFPLDSLSEIRPFGEIYSTPSVFARLEVGRAFLACTDEIVVLAPRNLIPEVFAYEPGGSVRWIARLPEYNPVIFVEQDDGSTEVQLPEAPFNRIESMMLLGGDVAIVQVATNTRASVQARAGPVARATYLIDIRSGRGGRIPFSHGRALAASRELLVTVPDLPYPGLQVYRIRQGPLQVRMEH